MPTAFRATYSDFKLIKTRQSVQIVFEIPLHDVDAALDILGGMPNPAQERWFGIAPLKTDAAQPQPESQPRPAGAKREKMDWRDMQPAAQAALRCDQPAFWAFLREEHGQAYVNSEEQAAEYVRGFCVAKSRAELSTDHRKRALWHQLDTEFLAWKQLEHA